MIRAYHDPSLRHPVSRDGTWNAAVEFVCATGGGRDKPIYLHNPSSQTFLLKLQAQASGFVITIPPSVNVAPGVTRLDVGVTAGALPLPTVVDFHLTGTVDVSQTGESGYADLAYSDQAYTLEADRLAGTLLKAEATAFCLPVGDERFGDLNPGPLGDVSALSEYVASDMGFAVDDYKAGMVRFMAEHLRDWCVRALKQHYMFTSGPMRHAKARAESIGYNPPGVPALHPALRRRVYASAYEIARKVGSADGIRAVFRALGINQTQLDVRREGFVWYVRVPQWIAATYDIDFLGNLALYHVDPYCVVNIAVNEGTIEHDYSDIDWTIEPGPAVQPPDTGTGAFLLLEDGVSYLLFEDGTKIELEEEPEPPTSNTVTYYGDDVHYGGEEVEF